MKRRNNVISLSQEQVEMLRKRFIPGCRVELLHMDDPQAPAVGTEGTVLYVDCIGTIHVKWDTGINLGLVYGVDNCKKIS